MAIFPAAVCLMAVEQEGDRIYLNGGRDFPVRQTARAGTRAGEMKT